MCLYYFAKSQRIKLNNNKKKIEMIYAEQVSKFRMKKKNYTQI